MTTYELHRDKTTPNTFRWNRDVDGVPFAFYIPQNCVPNPPPERIKVGFSAGPADVEAVKADIKAVVQSHPEPSKREHSGTVRYVPIGDRETWQIGEPYIPKTALPQPWPRKLYMFVAWN